MDILRFRVVLDHEQQVFRDIDLEPGGTLDELHEAILVAFDLENDQMASFYESDERWNKGLEIGLMDMGTSEEPIALMSQTDIPDETEPGDRYLYVYDFLNLLIFYVECVGRPPVQTGLEYPRIAVAFGDMPARKDEVSLESLLDGIDDPSQDRSDTAVEEEEDDWNEDEDGSFENLDDYQDLL